MDWNEVNNTILNWLTNTGIKIVVSIVILVSSFLIINLIYRQITKRIQKKHKNKHTDKTIINILLNVSKVVLKILVVLGIVNYLGLDTSSITAVIASTGLGIGLAVNGALSNFAGGILLLFTKPFKVDDYIKALGYEGTVEDILICNTKLRTIENKIVYIPNGKLSTDIVENFTEKGIRRMDIPVHVHYTTDLDKAETCIKSVLEQYDKVLNEPAPEVKMTAHGSSSIDFTARFWIKAVGVEESEIYEEDILELIKREFDKNGIQIPYNQMDVHIQKD